MLFAVIAVAVATVLFVIAAYVVAPFEQRNALRRRIKHLPAEQLISNRQLGERCLQVAKNLASDWADLKREDPGTLNWGTVRGGMANGEEWTDSLRAENTHRAKEMALYTRKYAPELGFLFDELIRRALVTSDEVWGFRTPASAHEVENVIAFLGAQGGRLTHGPTADYGEG